jgi:hypothetical protein
MTHENRRGWTVLVVLAGLVIGAWSFTTTPNVWAAGATAAPQETAAEYQGPAAEAFLTKARFVKAQEADKGITLPKKVTLELDGVTRLGFFKTIDEFKPGATRLPDGSVDVNFQDSWQTEIAAYQVDLMIGLGLVPATVERRYNATVGSLQWGVESMMSEAERIAKQISPPDVEAWNRLMFKVRLFDQLIANVDRHLNNILVTKDFDVRLIDHSRSFRTNREPARPDDLQRFSRALLAGIKRLEKADIKKRAGRYLRDEQIDRMLQRRDAILALVQKRIAEKGEAAVLYE